MVLKKHKKWYPKRKNQGDAMERKMELIRILLHAINDDQKINGSQDRYVFQPKDIGTTEYSQEEITYHINLLIEGGLINGDEDRYEPTLRGLTMAGHDFVDSTIEKTPWEKTKAFIKSKGGNFTIGAIQQILTGYVKEQLGLR